MTFNVKLHTYFISFIVLHACVLYVYKYHNGNFIFNLNFVFCDLLNYYCKHYCIQFNNDQTIVDSGTTDIFFPKKVFSKVKQIIISHFQVLLSTL